MKPSVAIILFFLVGIHEGLSQDSAASLSAKMLGNNRFILLSPLDGWIFKRGNDSSWANVEANTSDWMRLKPTQLSAKYADKTGEIEGWFRFKFKLDNDFSNMKLGLIRGGWAATEIYLDGNFFASFGSTGANGKKFQEYNPIDKKSTPLVLETGEEHLIAIHFVDYRSSLHLGQLKSAVGSYVRREANGLEYFIMLAGPEYDFSTQKNSLNTLFYRSVWLSVTLLLALLFWLLVILNPGERKTLLLIAVFSSASAISNVTRFFLTDPTISFVSWDRNNLLQNLCLWLLIVVAFFLTATILNLKISKNLTRFLILYILFGIATSLFAFGQWVMAISVFVELTAITVIIVSRWKKLKGAQWAIVAGLSLSILFGALFAFFNLRDSYKNYWQPLLTGFYLSFPLSLMVYVSLRFKEIINEVREHARRVVQMTEEKKEQAVKQQKALEEEVARQTVELRDSLENLKATQSQLIQQEKMASLGELTAGIAHEIQNPLNFVNNFSEVNKELIGEMKTEIEKGNLDDVKAIVADIENNEEKINHHGKRADAIVKGMLQHSRTSSGQKEPTDINALADEYLRLAYHGLRAKDKSFSAKFDTNFDPSIGKINVVPQDIGRVLLNLINNAFYAVNERKERLDGTFEPTVSVITKKLDGKIEIKVRDNGNGIPQKVLDKIFQPFFTTKPTGVGTGLGLSLSYDIIRAHGGEIKVETNEGEGSEFITQLPASN